MASLKLTNIEKTYGSTKVLKNIDLDIKQGEFVVFVGPSGCGKSTLLRMIAGLESITGGELLIDGQRMNEVPPSKRGIAMVFQTYALYPHMTVYDNMAFGMKIAKANKEEIKKRVNNAADILQLTPYLQRLPKALSGGQRQRVAIGRAIVRDPKVFLFDEPLSNLDAALRVATRIEISQLNESMPDTTMIYVTHDQVEAMTLADRIVVLSTRGTIEQCGAPMELYNNPKNVFVAQFIGSPAMNIYDCSIIETGDITRVSFKEGEPGFQVEVSTGAEWKGKKAKFGVRPEDLRLPTEGEEPLYSCEVRIVEKLGEVTLLYLEPPQEGDEPLIAKIPGNHDFVRGQSVSLTADHDKRHLFTEDDISFRWLDKD
ncbi:ABC transporter ATP-binding protein [Cohaesibacter celericrescens]|uniref:ABC transporter ATP-binding protein n=1 Tax=Cohaesibacter celericrescens TaxID=2067669 RepID=A0A2N5XQX4_9HYPH|nr:sn-glycerol-3-phosphate ABC transporter ATP-binding protein UgpC [Cohaesibacter celericrescens]PLW76922.1 ABC transporter ATP-binding protein [Cohaesibacter celericrescens]